MTATEISAMRAAVDADPTDAVVRLIYADALEDAGDEVGARIQRGTVTIVRRWQLRWETVTTAGRWQLRWEMDYMIRQYVQTALWSTVDEQVYDETGVDDSLSQKYTIDELAPETLVKAIEDCVSFDERYVVPLDLHFDGDALENLGHNLWLSRNWHGAGFFDTDRLPREHCDYWQEMARGMGEVNLYVGDDDLIYSSPG